MNVKKNTKHGSAPLQNLNIIEGLLIKAKERPEHLPGITTFSGPSGFGKSTSAGYVAAKYDCAYVECRSVWTKKSFLEALLRQLGVPAAKTMHKMADQISEELALSQRPVILDEFDHAVGKEGFVEMVRDIYEQSKSPVILIGEEKLPQKLMSWERFHGRIMSWGQALPANLADARALNSHYHQDVRVQDDLLEVLVHHARGSIRRIVTNLNEISEFAESEGLESISKKEWGNRPLQSSVAPVVRNF